MKEEHVGEFQDLLKKRAAMARSEEEVEAQKEAKTAHIKEKIAVLREQLEDAYKPFAKGEENMRHHLEIITEQIKDAWGENGKTQKVDGFIIRRRDLKGIEILNKDALIEELGKIGKLNASIKKFDDKLLIKLAEVDVLNDTNAKVQIRSSISCSVDKEAEPSTVIPTLFAPR